MELPEKISKIYDLFKNYYTEERVDITFVDPYAYIIVHWPLVTVNKVEKEWHLILRFKEQVLIS